MMEPAQLNQLIQAMSDVATAMRQQQQNNTSINIISNFDTFDPKIENFKNYKERLEIHFQVKKINEDNALRAKLLLQYIGSSNYALLASLAAPKDVKELTYEDIIKLLEQHFCQKKNQLVEQHRFLSEFQKEKESIAEFVAKLQKQSVDCNFKCTCNKSVANIFLRAQFIRGMRDNSIREQLLQNSEMKFDEIIEKALTLEASKLNSKEMSISSSTNVDIHQIRHPVNNNQRRNSRSRNNRRSQSRSKSRVNLHRLGIDGLCLRCGRNNHLSKECRIDRNNLKCQSCNRTGHIKRVCIQHLLKEKSISSIQENKINATDNVNMDINNQEYGVNKIIDIYNKTEITSKDVRKFFELCIEHKNQIFEVDSGAGYTLLPETDFKRLNLNVPLKKTNIAFRSYTGEIFKPLGIVNVNVEFKGRKSQEEMYIMSSKHSPLLGRVWIRHLNINLQDLDTEGGNVDSVHQINKGESIEKIINKYSDIFQPRVGCIPNLKCSLKLQSKARPVFLKEREVPFALREKVDHELDELERDGIITKVNTSNWGSPLVVIPKPDGNVRLCVDYKIAVNPQLEAAHYPIKRIDEIINNLRNSSYFCRLDLYKAYLHVQVDEESKIIQTISTHRGTYRMNRLSFGIKTAPSEFNRILDQILRGLEGTSSYFDDIIIHGSTLEECKQRLINCLDRLQTYNLHVNKQKCEYFKNQIQYLGYVISHNQISKCPHKTEAIKNIPRPENSDDVRRFLGMITYYSRFIPNTSTLTYPLRCLLEKDKKFVWTASCEAAFIKLKEEISTDRVLTPYDPQLPVTLACDASPTGIAAILSHVSGGEEFPIAFISRALTKAEQNYSQLDREALAIIFAVDKFFMYLYGRQFTLITDNRPLTRIFHENSKTPAMTSARLLRYASFLQGFNYKIQHRKAEEHVHVDCLSRATIKESNYKFEHFIDEEVRIIQEQTINQISTHNITAISIASETGKDQELSKLKEELIKGHNIDTEYSIQDGVIFKGHRVLIPKKLHNDILKELHHTHVGVVKMKQLARRYCYWKGIDSDIEKVVRSCNNCAMVKKNPPKVSHHWEEPTGNFERIHIDYAGPFQNHHFLVLVDAKSKWPEVKILKEAPTSEKTIFLLQQIFATHGLPQIMVSDNATIFQSQEFKKYCEENGIVQKFIAPGHPATNGLAERHIQTLKAKLNAMNDENLPLHIKVQEILYRYRATPLSIGKSPAQLYLGRELRIKLDALRPIKRKGNQQESTRENLHVRCLSVGDRVQVRWYTGNKPTWRFGIIQTKYGHLHYKVKLDNGYVLKRHINQLYRSDVSQLPKKTVTFADNTKKETVIKEPMLEEIQIERTSTGFLPQRQANFSGEQDSPLQRRPQRIRRPPSYLNDHVLY